MTVSSNPGLVARRMQVAEVVQKLQVLVLALHQILDSSQNVLTIMPTISPPQLQEMRL